MDFVNPKVSLGGDPVDTWYRYYAGYSAAFVEHTLTKIAPDASLILDPWNGTGTTTVVAANREVGACGYDINPAMIVVSRARLLGASVRGSIKALGDDIVGHADPITVAEDPLQFWFTNASAATLRGLQASIHRLLVDSAAIAYPVIRATSSMSPLAAFFYTVLFRTVRVLIAPAAGTNPTWWKRVPKNKRLRPRRATVMATFHRLAQELAEGLHRVHFNAPVGTVVTVGDCRKLPLEDACVDAVISSPPYCTRIDYGVSTRPELAVLGAGEVEVKELRDAMVGTPTISGENGNSDLWGSRAAEFLSRVSEHDSKASKGYYAKYFRQYYSGMWASLGELRRVTQVGAPVVLVVQDNHYKDIHNDTPGILTEMAEKQGFNNTTRHDFSVVRNRASMNPRARTYRKTATAVESVLVFQ